MIASNMEKKELILIWAMGFTLCIEQILAFKMFRADLYAFFPVMVIIVSLSLIKDKDGENIFPLIERLVRKRHSSANRRRQ